MILLVLIGIPISAVAEREIPGDPDKVKVTVTIPVYNDRDNVVRAVESVLAQTHQNLEIFVVDDHSSDDTFDTLVRAFAERKDPRLHLMRLNKNVGLYSLKNFVIKNLATGEFVTSQDSDDYSHPERIQRQVEHALRHGLDGAGMRIRRIDTDGSKVDVYTGYPNSRPPSGIQPTFDRQRYSSANVPSEDKAIYRTELVARLGGFDGHLRVEGDTDFANRFARVFWTGAYNDYPLYFWVRREGSLTTSAETGFSKRLWWLKEGRIPSWKRLRARLKSRFFQFVANVELKVGTPKGYVSAIARDLYYPVGLSIERYRGPGMPVGKYRDFDPGGLENRTWWSNYLASLSDWGKAAGGSDQWLKRCVNAIWLLGDSSERTRSFWDRDR